MGHISGKHLHKNYDTPNTSTSIYGHGLHLEDKAGRHPCSERNCELPIDDGDGFPCRFSPEIDRLGFLGMVSLLSIATMKILRLPLSISRAFAFRSASDTTLASSFLATTGEKHANDPGPCLAGVVQIRLMSWKQEALPASLETLLVALPCPQTPGGPPRQTIAALRCCLRYS